MDRASIEAAAACLAEARKTHGQVASLPASARPQSVQDAFAIQDAVTALLGLPVGGFKGSPAKAGSEATRGVIYQPTIQASPADVPAAAVPQCGVEGEVAFRFKRDMPPRPTPYSADEVAAAVDAYAAIEVVSSRFAHRDATTDLDRLADCISNGGFVYGAPVADWRGLSLADIKVVLTVNGETVVDQAGGHPSGDPFAFVVALVEMMRGATGIKAGQFATCGSYTGLRYIKPGDRCGVKFEGLGGAELKFVP